MIEYIRSFNVYMLDTIFIVGALQLASMFDTNSIVAAITIMRANILSAVTSFAPTGDLALIISANIRLTFCIFLNYINFESW